MKSTILISSISIGISGNTHIATVAFQPPSSTPPRFARTNTNIISTQSPKVHPTSLSSSYQYIDTSEHAARDIPAMISWCESYGVQYNLDFCPTSSFQQPGTRTADIDDRLDYTCYALDDLPAGTPILSVPPSIQLNSADIRMNEVGVLERAEQFLTKLREPLPLFYLYVKLLYEYSLGDQSAYYGWLDSLPRAFDTGTSMTPTCYECLPPLAATYAKTERVRYINYQSAAKTIEWLPEWLLEDRLVCKWLFNVVSTRSWEVEDGSGERVIVPMGDMFNHYYDPEVAISYDEQGNCVAYTTRDVSAGSELRISYGYVTNPSALFAKYGFIDLYAPCTFWKYMDIIPSTELTAIGLSYSRMLFYPTGDISPEIFDVLTYIILGEKNRQEQKIFYDACLNGDEDTKSAYLNEYYYEIYGRIKKHVDKFLKNLGELEGKAIRVDEESHPRIRMIREHNEFVKGIFLAVKDNVDAVMSQVA